MERDFMGLTPRNNMLPKVKQEATVDGYNSSVPARGTAMQWSFSNKVSALPQFLSFKTAQEDRSRKTGFDSLPSTGYITVSTPEAFDACHKPYSASLQKNLIPEKPMGTHYVIRTYLPHTVHHPQDVKLIPVSSQTHQTMAVPVTTSVGLPYVASSVQNMIGSAANPPFGGAHKISPVSIVTSSSPIVGTTNLSNSCKAPGTPAQLTIFYAGSVCVYDNVSPEKAQAIMLLAGNAPSVTPNTTPPTAQAQVTMQRLPVCEKFVLNQPHNIVNYGVSSPISGNSQNGSQSTVGPANTNEVTAVKPIGVHTSPPNRSESSKLQKSLGSVSGLMIPSAVPQARKASLARFLEKRKERVMSASPYASKQTPDCSTPESGSKSLSATCPGPCPLPAIN